MAGKQPESAESEMDAIADALFSSHLNDGYQLRLSRSVSRDLACFILVERERILSTKASH